MLEIHDLTKQFFGLTAVDSVSTRFERGQVSAIIGPNGAGKTTFFNLVAGTTRRARGASCSTART
jgi:branched-chain amino acid transport system ATP-binding protein